MSISQIAKIKVLFLCIFSILLFSCNQSSSSHTGADGDALFVAKVDPHKLPKSQKVPKEQRIAEKFEQEWETTRDLTTGLIP